MKRREFLKTLGAGAATAAAVSACKNLPSKPADGIEGPMEYRENPFSGDKVSLLGYGCMRWPKLDPDADELDQEAINGLVDRALEMGVNYFDTSPRYLRGLSEPATGEALARHPRESYYIATKMSNFPPETWSFEASRAMYETSFKNLRVDSIDYYLLHSLGEMDNYKARFVENGILDFLVGEKKAGRIRNLGFSYHGDNTLFDYLMELHDRGEYHWDFVQIEMNYYEWSVKKKGGDDCVHMYNELEKRGIPVVIMEPLLGGGLAKVGDGIVTRLKQKDPNASVASWACRFCGSFPGVLTVLSGMTYMEHLEDNLKTYCGFRPCSEEELAFLADTAIQISQFPTVPCTACQYCMPCPYGLDIPSIFAHYNKCVNEDHVPVSSTTENYRKARRAFLVGYDRAVDYERQASHCVGCHECEPKCPQGIKIVDELRKIDRYVEKLKQDTL
ncbi:MAG: aldo/keto reductase [Bacteroidales bacterium]|nr:aldo/keto reductase [Bacteroidales bacterium]